LQAVIRMFRDGPLTRRAPEMIRYGIGRCALGALLVASSERGIVSIMVRDTQSRLIRDLGMRFPKAKLVRDEARNQAIVAKVGRYVAAPFRPFKIFMTDGRSFGIATSDRLFILPSGLIVVEDDRQVVNLLPPEQVSGVETQSKP